jgi:hypothetical protein
VECKGEGVRGNTKGKMSPASALRQLAQSSLPHHSEATGCLSGQQGMRAVLLNCSVGKRGSAAQGPNKVATSAGSEGDSGASVSARHSQRSRSFQLLNQSTRPCTVRLARSVLQSV